MHDSSKLTFGKSNAQAMNATGSSDQQPSKQHSQRVASPRQTSSWFSLPTPIRQIFNAFPLISYSENQLPQHTSRSRDDNALHIFTLNQEELSPNPACLKWQAYLLVKGIPFRKISSNNHASPSGALPFVLPAEKSKNVPQPQAIPSSKIQRWAESQGTKDEQLDIRLEAYMSLIDQNIRNAWLYFLYLQKENFDGVAKRLYVETASSNTLVQATLAYQLQAAAKEQLLRTKQHIDEEEIYDAANAAFKALATLLAEQSFFSKSESPNLFDVTLFSYTHLLLSLTKKEREVSPVWADEALVDVLLRHETLVQHRDRVLRVCMEG